MSTQRPVIFISAVSRELHTARDLIAKTLLALGYEPKWQDIAATDAGDLRAVLRKWIDGSDAVLQLVGHCYGFAPDTPDPTFGECSYTQHEALYARQQGRPVYYIFTDPAHPTDGCGCEPQTLHHLQETYRQQVKTCGDLYHSTSSLIQTELIVRRLKSDLDHLRRRGRQHAALVLGLLVVLVLFSFLLMRDQQHTGESVSHTEKKIDQQTQISTQTQLAVAELKSQNEKILQAMRELPQALSQQLRSGAAEDEAVRMAGAYALLEDKFKLPSGTLSKELPEFARQLLQRADTTALDRATALFATRKFSEAEAEALKAKDQALSGAGKSVQSAVEALQLAGNAAREQIHYTEALDYYRAAIVLVDKERDPLKWAELQWDTAVVFSDQGKNAEAEALYRQVMPIYMKRGGNETLFVVGMLNNLAIALKGQGRYDEAAKMFDLVLKIFTDIAGPENPVALKCRDNRANNLNDQGRFDEAESEHRAVAALRAKVLGTEAPDTLDARMNLANTLRSQKKYAEAVKEHQAVLEIRVRVLGPEHPDTLNSRMNLANALNDLGRHDEAEKELSKVVALRERVLGARHPKTLLSRNNLATTLVALGRLAEAEKEFRNVLEIQMQQPGPSNPDTLATWNNLAVVLGDQKKYAEAEKEHRAVLEIQMLRPGPQHQDTLLRRMLLAEVLTGQEKHSEAEAQYRQVLEIRQKLLDAEYPEMGVLCFLLARSLLNQDKVSECLPYLRRAEQIWTKVLGPDHPNTRITRETRQSLEAALKKSPPP